MKKKILAIFLVGLFLFVTIGSVGLGRAVTKNSTDYWAVIMCAQDFEKDTEFLYKILKNKYGYSDDHIFYLHPNINMNGVDKTNSLNNISYAINTWLKTKSDSNDQVLLYFSSHGGGYDRFSKTIWCYNNSNSPPDGYDGNHDEGMETKESTIGWDVNNDGDQTDWIGVDECIWDKTFNSNDPNRNKMGVNVLAYRDDAIKQDLNGLSYGKLIFIFQGCYSGGLIDDLSKSNRVIITATSETQESWWVNNETGGYSTFSKEFLSALNGTYPDGSNLQATPDTNNDGMVSFNEAYMYAKKYDPKVGPYYYWQEDPWLDDNGDGYPTYKEEMDLHVFGDGGLSNSTYLGPINHSPGQPYTPSGPTSGRTGISYSYSTSATDPDNDSLAYYLDWGDGTGNWTALVSSGFSASASHIWSNPGIYPVKSKARDVNGAESNWSPPIMVTISVNNHPETPTITGQTSGKIGIEYEYTFVSTDPEGDNITYCIDWGDNTSEVFIGPYLSGVEASANHTWSEKGDYAIKAKARDIYGAESDWVTLVVSLPKDKGINLFFTEFLQKLFQRFPFIEKILK